MNQIIKKIGFGGGCHWCTEAVFQSLKGVERVAQGWITSTLPNDNFSEGVIVYFNPEEISVSVLIKIHLHTHSSTSKHTMRNKYRSAVYAFSIEQLQQVRLHLDDCQQDFEVPIITEALPFVSFKENTETYQNYYYSDPTKAFCQTYISPKLKLLINQFSSHVNKTKVGDQ